MIDIIIQAVCNFNSVSYIISMTNFYLLKLKYVYVCVSECVSACECECVSVCECECVNVYAYVSEFSKKFECIIK